ncbi:MAG: SUMF1/EgtB/PvdO family nonheme iron enzyme [Verrucomicrobiales bacterium]|nr:SUMF1/EgtB/PvdO family nonheme iron enzyme [Verrucomicrobiales bacterium]
MKLLLLLFPLATFGSGLLPGGETKLPVPPPGMIHIPGGDYKPLYAKEAAVRRTPAYFMGTTPVTNGEFLAFVAAHPEWRRSKVTRSVADVNYLRHWAGDMDLGDTASNAPVVNVSWFAAQAYCESKGLRLPTQDEWEFAGRADATRADASADQAFLRKLLEWYSKPATGTLPEVQSAEANIHGLRGMHGLVWEWVQDFNSTLIVGDSRGDDSLERKLFCGAGALAASDASNYAAYMRYAFRSSLKGAYCVGSLGFRTARPVETPPVPAVPIARGAPYDLKSKWQAQDGREIALNNLAGKVRVVTMGFTSCAYACPRITSDMQRIETALGADAQKAGFVFFSIDPARDTPARLTEYAQERKLDLARWDLLTSTADAVRDLAVALDFKYEQVEKDFAHSNLIAVLDAKGAIIHRQETLNADIASVVSAVKNLLATP